jgi:hypothetical protein
MTYDEAVKIIEQVLKSAQMNYDTHVTVQGAWKLIKERAKDGDDAIPVQRPVQPSQ